MESGNIGGLAAMAGAGSPGISGAFQDVLDKYKVPLPPSQEDRTGALNSYTEALKAPSDDRSPLTVLLQGGLLAENPADRSDVVRNSFKYKMLWDQTQREAVKKSAEMAAKAQYEDIVARQRAFDAEFVPLLKSQMTAGRGLNGFEFRKNTDGTTTAFSRATGQPVGTYGPQDINKLSQLTQMLAKAAFEKGEYSTLDEALAWAQGEALKQVASMNSAVGNRQAPLQGNVGGVPTTPGPQMQHPPVAVEMDGVSTQPSSLPPEVQDEVARLITRVQTNPSPELHAATVRRLKEIANQYGTAAAPQTMPKLDVAKQTEKVETSKKSADMYATSFDTNVVKPAAAFTDTGKIMTEFNRLGELNAALKNGRLKEFMAGDAGKWALSFLPENSDLRRGIANAQEAEKLTAGMINQILLAAKGVQTEGDAERARSQVTSIGTDPMANKYLEAYVAETARQLKAREQSGLAHKKANGTFEDYDNAWLSTPLMKEARGSVKQFGNTFVGVTQYIQKFKEKNPTATDSEAIQSWNRIK